MQRFNKGDVVLISKNIKTTPLLWLSGMDAFIGVEAIITDMTKAGNYKLNIDNGRFAWHPLWLTLIKNKKSVTNFEYYAEKIKEITKQGCNFGVTKDGEIRCCQNMLCSNCIFDGNGFQCAVSRTKWLYKNVKQEKEIVLSEKERKLLEILPEQYKYIARDKSGTLYAYMEKPYKNGISPAWRSKEALSDCFRLSQFELPFAFVEWEDDAAYKISDLLSLPKVK